MNTSTAVATSMQEELSKGRTFTVAPNVVQVIVIQKRSGDIPIQITHTLTRYTHTHWEYTLTGQVSWDFRGVIGEIQLRVPLRHVEHYTEYRVPSVHGTLYVVTLIQL